MNYRSMPHNVNIQIIRIHTKEYNYKVEIKSTKLGRKTTQLFKNFEDISKFVDEVLKIENII